MKETKRPKTKFRFKAEFQDLYRILDTMVNPKTKSASDNLSFNEPPGNSISTQGSEKPVTFKVALIHSVQEKRKEETPHIIAGQLQSMHKIFNKFPNMKKNIRFEFIISLVIADSEQIFRLKSKAGMTSAAAYAEALKNGVYLVESLSDVIVNFLNTSRDYSLTFELVMWNQIKFENFDAKYIPPKPFQLIPPNVKEYDDAEEYKKALQKYQEAFAKYKAALAKWAEVYPTQLLADLTDESKFSEAFKSNHHLVNKYCNNRFVNAELNNIAKMYANHFMQETNQAAATEGFNWEKEILKNILESFANNDEMNIDKSEESDVMRNSLDHFCEELKFFAVLRDKKFNVLLYGIDKNPSPRIQRINTTMRVLTTALFQIKYEEEHKLFQKNEEEYQKLFQAAKGAVNLLEKEAQKLLSLLPSSILTSFVVFYFYSTKGKQQQKHGEAMEVEEKKSPDNSHKRERAMQSRLKQNKHHPLTKFKPNLSNSESSLHTDNLSQTIRRTWPMTTDEQDKYVPMSPDVRETRKVNDSQIIVSASLASAQSPVEMEITQEGTVVESYGALTQLFMQQQQMTRVRLMNEKQKLEIEKIKAEVGKLQVEKAMLEAETEKTKTETQETKALIEARTVYYQAKANFWKKKIKELPESNKEEEMSEALESKEEEMSEQSSPEGSQEPFPDNPLNKLDENNRP